MPAYTMNGRNYMPVDSTLKPGPGQHRPEKVRKYWMIQRTTKDFLYGEKNLHGALGGLNQNACARFALSSFLAELVIIIPIYIVSSQI